MRDPFAVPDEIEWDRIPQHELRAFLDSYRFNKSSVPSRTMPGTALERFSVGALEIDWSQMPSRIIVQATNYDTGPIANGGWALTPTGAFASLPGSRCYVDVSTMLPARVGYTRQYRFVANCVYNTAAVATTGAQWQWRFSDTAAATVADSEAFVPALPFNTTKNNDDVGAWFTNATLDGLAAQFGFFSWNGQVTGAVYTNACRVVALQGRYVRS